MPFEISADPKDTDLRAFLTSSFQEPEIVVAATEFLENPLADVEDVRSFDSFAFSEMARSETVGSFALPGLGTLRTMKRHIYWELHRLICTEDPEYQDVRNKTSGYLSTVAPIVTTAIAGTLSLPAAIVAGFVTVALLAFTKISRNAWCAWAESNSEER